MPPLTASARAPAKEILASNVLFQRARLRLSQTELAERSSVSRTWISRIEGAAAESPGLDVIERIANALGVPIAQLFVDHGDDETVDDAELARRAAAPASGFVDARALLDAVDEAAGRPNRRYSTAGRPRLPR